MTWDEETAEWWVGEVSSDPAYREVVVPLLVDVLEPAAGMQCLDLGCGEGGVMRALAQRGVRPIGCDAAPALAERASSAGPVVVARLPDLSWLAAASLDAAYAVLVLEHLADHAALFEAAARVVRPGGALAVVSNHPAFTAPESAPVLDPEDGEVLWRWGGYLGGGASEVPAGGGTIVFHHRSMGDLLGAAAAAGWCLERLVEVGVGEHLAESDPLLALQRDIPRLAGLRWRRAEP